MTSSNVDWTKYRDGESQNTGEDTETVFTDKDYKGLLEDISAIRDADAYSKELDLEADQRPSGADWREWGHDILDGEEGSLGRTVGLCGQGPGNKGGDQRNVDRLIDEVIDTDVEQFKQKFSSFTGTEHYDHLSVGTPMNYESDPVFNIVADLAEQFGKETEVLGRDHYRLELNEDGNVPADTPYIHGDEIVLNGEEIRERYNDATLGLDLRNGFTTSNADAIYIDKWAAEEYSDSTRFDWRVA